MTIEGNDISISGDDPEFIKPSNKKYTHGITISHWQLRDLITCPNNSQEYIYTSEASVNMYNTQTRQVTPMLKGLTFLPTSITTGCNYLAAGGHQSQLMVRHLQNNWTIATTVGGSINNALCISQHPDGTRLLICNNDETIKVYTLPNMQRISVLPLPTAVNYASVSPDGRKMVAVGDTNQVFLFDISASGTYKKTATLIASNDSSFSCSWNQTSEKFAVASQDGFVSVWDIRSSNKLCKLGSKQRGRTTCATRCVKFSPSGLMDLLMYSEHINYVNFIDARTFNSTQSIRVAPPNSDVNISGCTWTPDGLGVFIGTERYVLEYEVNAILRRSFAHGSLL